MLAYPVSTAKVRCSIICAAAAIAALSAMCAGCSRTATEGGTPPLAAASSRPAALMVRAPDIARGGARLAAFAPSDVEAAAPASAMATPSARDPLAGDVMERELGTASDGGYFAYPAR